MAKMEYRLTGDFDALVKAVNNGILNGSVSASYEDGSIWRQGDVRCAVNVYERYSAFGSNRVSLNVTVIGSGRDLFVSAITSGGSQAMFFKLNTVGEESFLKKLDEVVRRFQAGG